MRPLSLLAPRRGRPRKFPAPSRAVTLTLPEDVLASLGAIDADLSRAIVRIAQTKRRPRGRGPAELVEFGGRAVIVVNSTRTLEKQTGVLLIPLSDGRALISFDETMTPARLELGIKAAARAPAWQTRAATNRTSSIASTFCTTTASRT